MKVVFASTNAGKIYELQALLVNLNLVIIPQLELAVDEIAESGLTFIENALIKARHACQVSGLPAIADDSGLEVAALQGAPGIYSARYAGVSAPTHAHIEKLLISLQNTPEIERKARFHCTMVYMAHANDPTPLICEGVWHGSILKATQGTAGFGYDPVFYVPSEKCSAAELPLNVKNRLSHRGQALRQLIEKLPGKIGTSIHASTFSP